MRDDDWIALQVAQADVVDSYRRREARRARLRRVLLRRLTGSRLHRSQHRPLSS